MSHEIHIETLSAERYVLGELRAAERENFEEHFFVCPLCARDVEELSGLASGVAQVERELPAPEVAKATGWRRFLPSFEAPSFRFAFVQPAALVFSLTLVLALGGLTTYQTLELRRLQSSGVALASLTLQPETRGAVPAAARAADAKYLLVEADVPGAQGPLVWTLRSGGDNPKTLLSGTAAAPEAGASLKVLLPAKATPPGEYVLEVHKQNGGAGERFRFKIAEN